MSFRIIVSFLLALFLGGSQAWSQQGYIIYHDALYGNEIRGIGDGGQTARGDGFYGTTAENPAEGDSCFFWERKKIDLNLWLFFESVDQEKIVNFEPYLEKGGITFFIRAAAGSTQGFVFWLEDFMSVYSNQIGINGEFIGSTTRIQRKPFDGTWQKVVIPFSLLRADQQTLATLRDTCIFYKPSANLMWSAIRMFRLSDGANEGAKCVIGPTKLFIDEIKVVPNITTEISEPPQPSAQPKGYFLSQNYPNPFNAETEIHFQLPKASWVLLRITNVIGQMVKTLVNEFKSPGSHVIRWDGRDNAGRVVPSGEYLYRIEAGHFTETKKMLLVK